VVRLTCPCRVSRYEPGQLLSLQSGAAFRELVRSEVVSGSAGAEALTSPLSAGRPAGRLVFPVGFRRCASALADCRSAGGSGRPRVDLVTVPLLRRQRAGSRGPSLASGLVGLGVWSGLLSWGSKIAPPPISMLCVHSRVGQGLPFGSEAPTSVLVPSLSFHPTPTVFSAQHRAGLLHPATGHGVRHVAVAVAPPWPEGPGGVAATFPMAHTLRSFSLPGSCTVSPRPVPSRCSLPLFRACRARCRSLSARSGGLANLKALSHQRVRC
jgi:hypothetical protein